MGEIMLQAAAAFLGLFVGIRLVDDFKAAVAARRTRREAG
jgi:hypothetical protein